VRETLIERMSLFVDKFLIDSSTFWFVDIDQTRVCSNTGRSVKISSRRSSRRYSAVTKISAKAQRDVRKGADEQAWFGIQGRPSRKQE
jgi:hypothetical protein